MRNGAAVDVSLGNAIFSGSILVSVRDSSFSVSGGYVEFSGSSKLSWERSELSVSSGDMRFKGLSIVSFLDSNVEVSGGSIGFNDESIVDISDSSFTISLGSVNFLGETVVSFTNSKLQILGGDLQFAEDSKVTFTQSPIHLSGQLEFIGDAQSHFIDSSITIVNGNFHAKDNCAVFFDQCQVDIHGSVHTQNQADIRIEDSRLVVDNGDVRINDQGSFTVHRSSLVITSGNFIARNPSLEERKYISFSQSVISVERTSNNVLNGHMELMDNVEMSLISSDVVIDGDLVVTGNARLNIFEESSFVIPTGVVSMDVTSSIIIDGSSSLLNQGQLVAPGQLRIPGDSSASNEGLLESDHDFNANCFDDLTDGAPLANSGTFRMGSNSNTAVQSCVDNLQHSGLMQLGNANVTFNLIHTTTDSIITLSGSSVSVGSNAFQSAGSVGGTGAFGGSFVNNGDAVVMANGETGPTVLDIDGDFTNDGTMFFSINSRNINAPGALTQITSGRNVQFNGGRACICFNPGLQLEEGDRFDLVLAGSALVGEYDEVEFDCVECPRRNAKSIEGSEASCDPKTDYGGASFSVLLDACNGGTGNYFENISPPIYVILPVAFGIVLFVLVFFGGALLVEQRLRKKKVQKQIAERRKHRVQRIVSQNQKSGSSASS